jgi:hypothetical protein
LWDPLAAMICVDPEIALTESMSISLNLKTAQIKCVDKNSFHSSIINIATKIPNSELILGKFIEMITSNKQSIELKENISLEVNLSSSKLDEKKRSKSLVQNSIFAADVRLLPSIEPPKTLSKPKYLSKL